MMKKITVLMLLTVIALSLACGFASVACATEDDDLPDTKHPDALSSDTGKGLMKLLIVIVLVVIALVILKGTIF